MLADDDDEDEDDSDEDEMNLEKLVAKNSGKVAQDSTKQLQPPQKKQNTGAPQQQQ